MSSEKSLAIIGAGPSGLASAKYALEYGWKPVIFEKSPQVSGLWSAKETAIWNGLKMNSIFPISQMSDQRWPLNTRLYPLVSEVNEQLVKYSEKFGINNHIRFNHKVEFVRCLEDKQTWEITYQNVSTKETNTERFDYLIIASGAFQNPYIPKDENAENFKGSILHSAQFRLNDDRLKSKDVIVVGGSLSSTDISSQLVGHAKSVVNLFRSTPFVVPLLWKERLSQNEYSIVPYEFLTFIRRVYYAKNIDQDEHALNIRSNLKRLFPFQMDKNPKCPESLHMDVNQSFRVGLSDHYMDRMKDGKIKPIRDKIKRFDENGVYLESGEYLKADVIIYCTGYKLPAAEYLDKPVLDAMKYDESRKLKLMLYKATVVPGYETLGYVGESSILFFNAYELQAKYAVSLLSGKVKRPSLSEIEEYQRSLEDILNYKGPKFPHPPFVTFFDQIAKELGMLPDLERLKETDNDLYEHLWNDVVLWPHFLEEGEKASYYEQLRKFIRDIKSKVYRFDSDEADIKQAEVIEKFSTNFKY